MPNISVRAIQLVGLLLLVVMTLVGGAASARASGRRLGLTWLDAADAEDVPPIDLGAAFSAAAAAAAAAAPAMRGDSAAATFDADLDADLAADGAGDNALVAQPERRSEQAPPSAAKRTLQDICDNIALRSKKGDVAGYLWTGLLACSCDEGLETVMLGDLHYPHRVPQVRCRAAPHCRMRYYDMPLLTRGKTVKEEAGMPLVPEPLRKHWRFEFKKIAVACECVHPDLNGM